jgi:Fe-Mn family superoxide dismutase
MKAYDRRVRDGDEREPDGRFVLPPLPWPVDALEPTISATAMALHHQKHHGGYVERLNDLILGTSHAELPLEVLIRATAADPLKKDIYNNASQVWNHTFFFEGLKPPGPSRVPKRLRALIDIEFGSLEGFSGRFARIAVERFGAGWAWLVLRGWHLEILSTPNAGSPIITDAIPLLAIDLWEHAYYLNYHDRRESYVRAMLGMLVDWEVVARRAALEDLASR